MGAINPESDTNNDVFWIINKKTGKISYTENGQFNVPRITIADENTILLNHAYQGDVNKPTQFINIYKKHADFWRRFDILDMKQDLHSDTELLYNNNCLIVPLQDGTINICTLPTASSRCTFTYTNPTIIKSIAPSISVESVYPQIRPLTKNVIALYNLNQKEPINLFKVHTKEVTSLDFRLSKSILAGADITDNELCIYGQNYLNFRAKNTTVDLKKHTISNQNIFTTQNVYQTNESVVATQKDIYLTPHFIYCVLINKNNSINKGSIRIINKKNYEDFIDIPCSSAPSQLLMGERHVVYKIGTEVFYFERPFYEQEKQKELVDNQEEEYRLLLNSLVRLTPEEKAIDIPIISTSPPSLGSQNFCTVSSEMSLNTRSPIELETDKITVAFDGIKTPRDNADIITSDCIGNASSNNSTPVYSPSTSWNSASSNSGGEKHVDTKEEKIEELLEKSSDNVSVMQDATDATQIITTSPAQPNILTKEAETNQNSVPFDWTKKTRINSDIFKSNLKEIGIGNDIFTINGTKTNEAGNLIFETEKQSQKEQPVKEEITSGKKIVAGLYDGTNKSIDAILNLPEPIPQKEHNPDNAGELTGSEQETLGTGLSLTPDNSAQSTSSFKPTDNKKSEEEIEDNSKSLTVEEISVFLNPEHSDFKEENKKEAQFFKLFGTTNIPPFIETEKCTAPNKPRQPNSNTPAPKPTPSDFVFSFWEKIWCCAKLPFTGLKVIFINPFKYLFGL